MDGNGNRLGRRRLQGNDMMKFKEWEEIKNEWVALNYMDTLYNFNEWVKQRKHTEEFLNHILQKQYDDWRFFAHFGGRYDFNFIFDYVRNKLSEIEVSFFCSGAT